MKKIMTAALSFVAAFALVAGIAGVNNAQAAVLGNPAPINSSNWSWHLGWDSDKLVYGSSGTGRRATVVAQNNSSTRTSGFVVEELTGSGSYDDYFDCAGNEVYSALSACEYTLNPNSSIGVTVKLGNSSFWKDRDGVFIYDGTADDDAQHAPNVSYSITAL
jgi:hypothetical protein